jgi:hypothetical protein
MAQFEVYSPGKVMLVSTTIAAIIQCEIRDEPLTLLQEQALKDVDWDAVQETLQSVWEGLRVTKLGYGILITGFKLEERWPQLVNWVNSYLVYQNPLLSFICSDPEERYVVV